MDAALISGGFSGHIDRRIFMSAGVNTNSLSNTTLTSSATSRTDVALAAQTFLDALHVAVPDFSLPSDNMLASAMKSSRSPAEKSAALGKFADSFQASQPSTVPSEASDGTGAKAAATPKGLVSGFKQLASLISGSVLDENTKNVMLDDIANLMTKAVASAKSGSTLTMSEPKGTVWKKEDNNGQPLLRLGDAYSIKLNESDQSFEISSLKDSRKIRVWGDPHVDIGADNVNDFNFKKALTFQLDDGTKITVDTVPAGNGETLSSSLTITNGDNAFEVTGLAGDADGKNNLKVVQSQNGVVLDQQKDDGATTIYERAGNWETVDGRKVTQDTIKAVEATAT
ncbi:DUF1521 domain-containing protein [Methylobacterium sp. J-076]|uniref:DUF1521 domain-containing protein n=1 Tax=Methylobacterium sp. J-076 TaxID=2836655 RepID=UPI001FBBEDF3|nr:DUF1521 domain-containing protein [Methylobacterium sp. J-076]MCJ2013116.1 DUF1521 domain-containing protein [Methylobacterium sp. J-076]